MKRRTLKSYRPDVGLYLCSNAGRIWHEVVTPTGQTMKYRSLAQARKEIKLWYGPELKTTKGE